VDTPVEVVLGKGLSLPGPTLILVEEGSGSTFPAQGDEVASGVRLRFILAGTTGAGSERAFRLVAGTGEPVVTVHGSEATCDIRHRDRPMLCYRQALVAAPAGTDPLHARNAYVHPLYSPSGKIVSGDFPADHPHQRGVFLAWTRTDYQGRQPDFWNLGKGSARVRSSAVERQQSGPVWGGFVAHHVHEDLKAPGGPVAVLAETWQVTAWAVGGPEAGWWLWDLDVEQRAVQDTALVLPKYRYGGMAFRGNGAWVQRPWEFLTSAGKTRADADGTAGAWADLSGELEGDWAGLTLIGHPANVHSPQPFRCHPAVPYFCFAPSQRGPWRIEPGVPLLLRYRFLVHDGRPDMALAERLYRDFAEPPQVLVGEPP
jgi:hypothetical protein